MTGITKAVLTENQKAMLFHMADYYYVTHGDIYNLVRFIRNGNIMLYHGADKISDGVPQTWKIEHTISLPWYELLMTYLADRVLCKPVDSFEGELVYERDVHDKLKKFYLKSMEYFWSSQAKEHALHPVHILYLDFLDQIN